MKLPRSTVIFLIIAAVLVIGLTVSFARRPADFAGYLLVGNLALSGHDIYRDAPPGINNWPPLFSLACIPLALIARLSVIASRVAWLVLNWGALAYALAASIRLVYGQPLALAGVTRGGEAGIDFASGAALLPLLLSVRWSLSNFEHLQVNIVILALVLAGLVSHRAGRDVRAGALIGAAAALKVMPVVFVPYFLWRRQWRPALFTTIATAGWSLLPVVVYGPQRLADQFGQWLEFFRRGHGVGAMNVSVPAMVDRIVGYGMVPFTVPGSDNVAPSGSSLVRLVVIGALALVTALACWWFRGRYDPRSRAAVAEWSIVLLVAAIFSPLTWKYYLVVLLLPMTLFVATWRDPSVDARFRQRLRQLTWLGFAIGMAAANLVVGDSFARRMEMSSVPAVMSLLILGTLFWYRARNDSAAASAPT